MKKFGVWILLLGLFGCGGGAAKRYSPAYAEAAPTSSAYGEAAGAPPAEYDMEAEASEEAAYDFDDGSGGVEYAEKSRMEPPSPSPVSVSAPGTSAKDDVVGSDDTTTPPTEPAIETSDEPMVIYSGYLQLRVKRLLDAVDQITKMVEERGGYIDSLTQTAVTVRIPGKGFEEAMAALAAVGELLDRWVRAEDVTEQFTDLKGRLKVAEEARERLLKLLAKVQNVNERLRILHEIKRLSELIDTIDSRLAAIRNLVDYFTITIDLVPVLAVERVDTGLSPFGWIRGLKAHVQTLYENDGKIFMTLPKGFVLFDEEDSYRAQAADTSVIRAAVVQNDPVGDNRYWADAVDFEMTTRQEKIVDSGEAGKVTFRVYENDDVLPRFYLVGLLVQLDKVYVVEVFYPNKEAYERHHAAVLGALETVEVK